MGVSLLPLLGLPQGCGDPGLTLPPRSRRGRRLEQKNNKHARVVGE